MDVDGTLTDGKIYMGNEGEVMKAFDIKDGYGIHDLLPMVGIVPVIITGRQSKIVENRCKEIGIVHLYQGVTDKTTTLISFLEENSGSLNEVAYIGDDQNDINCMTIIKENGGHIGCPADASDCVKSIANFISRKCGGNGAVREYINQLIIEE